MGCEIALHGATVPEAGAVRALFTERELALSRFLETSELSTLNRSTGSTFAISDTLAAALADALAAAAATRGLVDPTIAAALVDAGYDRDLGEIASDPRTMRASVVPGWRLLVMKGRILERPPGLLLDLNGVVKGRAVDDALELISGRALVSAGGDIAARGVHTIGLPGGDAVDLHSGGIATSGTTTRSWTRGGEHVHHLIDPREGRPAASSWEYVTVAAASCLAADVAAKAAFVLGDEGPAWLDAHELPGRFVDTSGVILTNRCWSRGLERKDRAA
jgi:thiamine biosynthesis lipoprotein